ncbi:hypothetical protein ACFL5M_02895 [Candidatus Neomarinimicrobiota bacterium]
MMKTNTIRFVMTTLMVSLLLDCDQEKGPTDPSRPYIDLAVNSFMTLTPHQIADSLASILHAGSVIFIDIDQREYHFSAGDSAEIFVWNDRNLGVPSVVQYLRNWYPDSKNITYPTEAVQDRIDSLLMYVGINPNGTESYELRTVKSHPSDSVGSYWADMYQTYQGRTLAYPFLYTRIDAETGDFHNLVLRRWYDHLGDIEDTLTYLELEDRARKYYRSREDVIRIADELSFREYFSISNDKLCKMIGGASISQYDELMLYLDVQNGEVVATTIAPRD